MVESSGEFCVIFKEKGKWTRKFFEDLVLAEKFRDDKPKEARAFIRMHVVVTTGGKTPFYTAIGAQHYASKIKDAAVSVLNPGIEDLPPALLYSPKKEGE